MTGAAPRFAVEVYEWEEAFRSHRSLIATIKEGQDCQRERKFGVPPTRPYRQRILAAGEGNAWPVKTRGVCRQLHCDLPGIFRRRSSFLQKVSRNFEDADRRGGSDSMKEPRPATIFSAAPGDEVESRELLKKANGDEELRTVTALVRRIFSVRAAAAERITTGAEWKETPPVMFANCRTRPRRPIGELNLF